MTIAIYILAGISILLAIGGLSAYSQSKSIGLLLSSIISIGFSILAIVLVHWWPLIVGFVANFGLKLAGLEPGSGKRP